MMRPAPTPTPWQLLRQHRRACAGGAGLGLLACAAAKHLAALYLILWLLAGGQ